MSEPNLNPDSSVPNLEQRNPALERVLWAFLILILLGVSSVTLWKIATGHPAKPPIAPSVATPSPDGGYGEVPEFSLTDQNGNTVTLADLKGKVWVADFFFTHCSGKCQMMTMRMATLQSALPPGDDGRLVSITVDPSRDSPEVLASWAKQFGSKDDRWLFLTGDLRDIIRFAREGFHLSVTEDPTEHAVRLVLVDRAARIRGYFDLDEESVAKLRRQLESLLSGEQP